MFGDVVVGYDNKVAIACRGVNLESSELDNDIKKEDFVRQAKESSSYWVKTTESSVQRNKIHLQLLSITKENTEVLPGNIEEARTKKKKNNSREERNDSNK